MNSEKMRNIMKEYQYKRPSCSPIGGKARKDT